MKVTVRDPETLMAVQPLELMAYLRARGWHVIDRVLDKATIWRLTDAAAREFEILVPLDRHLRDFAARMSEAVRTLEVAEERSQLEILGDLTTTTADVVRIGVDRFDAIDGSIPLEVGVQLLGRVHDLVMAVACAALTPRPYFQPRKPAQAVEYLRKVRMGQTERGSYVVTVVSPVPPILTPAEAGLLFPPVEDPFERRATSMLAKGLAATRQAAARAMATGSLEAFHAAVDEGVSANLCEALAGMGNDLAIRDLAISFSWSPARPLRNTAPHKILFPADALPVIKEAGRVFRETAPYEDFEVRGVVIRLDRPQNTAEGKVTILGFVDGEPRKITRNCLKKRTTSPFGPIRTGSRLFVTATS